MESFVQDVRYALRKLAASPGFALLTVATLALGIGANCAIFSVVNGVILRPLAYPEPGRLTFITSQFPALGFDQFWISAPEFLEFRDWNRAFDSVGAYTVRGANLGTDQPSRPTTALVTSELMPTLGVPVRMGRLFTLEDTLPGAEDVAILSDGLWRASFNADPTILNRSVKIDGLPTRIVGVMPPGYDVHGQKVELWLPLTIDPHSPGGRGSHFLYLVGRLKSGTTIQQARVDLDRLLGSWQAQAKSSHAPDPKNHRFRIDNLQDDIVGNVKKSLWVLQGAVGFVLLIACANLANLLLARADSRRREFAVRAALGASRLRMLGQFVTEGIVISVLGGVLGVLLAAVGLRALLQAYPDSIPRSAEVTLDWRVLIFTLGVAVATGIVFGLAPLLHLREQGVGSGLNEGGTRTTAGTARARTRNALVMSEVALAVVLVVGAGLLLRSFWELMRVDGGFDRSRLDDVRSRPPRCGVSRPAAEGGRLHQAHSAYRAHSGCAGRGGNERPAAPETRQRERHGFRGHPPDAGPSHPERRLLQLRDDGLRRCDEDTRGFRPGIPGKRRYRTARGTDQPDARQKVLSEHEPDWQGSSARFCPIDAAFRDHRRHPEGSQAGRAGRCRWYRVVLACRSGPSHLPERAVQHEPRRALDAAVRDARAAVARSRSGGGHVASNRADADDGGGVRRRRAAAAVPGAAADGVCGARPAPRRGGNCTESCPTS